MSGKVAAFAHFGVKLRNDRWSWSGRTDDGKIVALLLWKDHFNYKNSPISWSDFEGGDPPNWSSRPGNLDRIDDIKWAIRNCDGAFHVVVGVAKDTSADPRETKEAYPQDKMLMKIVKFNEDIGEFYAELQETK